MILLHPTYIAYYYTKQQKNALSYSAENYIALTFWLGGKSKASKFIVLRAVVLAGRQCKFQ